MRACNAVGKRETKSEPAVVSCSVRLIETSENERLIGFRDSDPEVLDPDIHDGIFTCEEWKKFMEQLFVSGDKGRKGFLTRQEFDSIKKADPSLADADFGYFDENQDGKVSRKEFVEKPSVFILRFDKNGDCRVTPEELKAATTPQPTGGPQERPRDRFH